MRIKNYLPAYWQSILPGTLLDKEHFESKATCTQCIMVNKKSEPFLESTKCCTYQPFLSNYLVGGLLKQNNPHIYLLSKTIESDSQALPVGLIASQDYQMLYSQKKVKDFGRREDLLCSYYVQKTGECSVWNFRDSQCSTYFCESNYGANGEKFWALLQNYLYQLELLIAQEILLEKGFHLSEIEDQLSWVHQAYFGFKKDFNPRRLWSHQSGQDKKTFYTDCYIIFLNKIDEFRREAHSLYKKLKL